MNGKLSTNQALNALGLRKEFIKPSGTVKTAQIFRGGELVFTGKLKEINAWIREQPNCPADF